MEDITQELQKLTKSRRIQRLVYKQSTENRASLFVDDLSVK
jgi:hypothetical protein